MPELGDEFIENVFLLNKFNVKDHFLNTNKSLTNPLFM